MDNPWLTLVTITKDDPAGLARTLASAVALREAGAEQIVVDGSGEAPTGGTEDRESPPSVGVRRLMRPADGIAAAFNAGIDAATGEWIWFLNGGDAVDARLESVFLSTLLADTGADVVIGATTYAGESRPRPHPPAHLRWPPFRSWIPHPSTLVRRRLFEQHGLFDSRYTIAMDYEWWLRAIPTGDGVDVLSVPFAVFAPGGLSQRPESLAVLRREHREALRCHRTVLMKSWWAVNIRLARAWGRSWLVGGQRRGGHERHG